MVVSGACDMKVKDPDLYTRMMTSKASADPEVVAQINTDLNRTFPNNIYFMKEDPQSLQQPLFNVLFAFANAYPKIGYCQVKMCLRFHFTESLRKASIGERYE